MKNILKLTGVSMLAIVAATNANAAGYTCEELVEYTSCSPGYYLTGADSTCPDGYTFARGVCQEPDSYAFLTDFESAAECSAAHCAYWDDECEDPATEYASEWFGDGCLKYWEDDEGDPHEEFIAPIVTGTAVCEECPAGSSCMGGTKTAVQCASGTYQSNTKQTACIDAPVGNYVAGTGATSYTACPAGSYQPTAGQTSCLECPAGSYCATTGLSSASGQCAKGYYALAGATVCASCPSTGLTDKEGKSVSATTVSTGSTSVMACYISNDVYFVDTKGTYHFSSNCNAFDLATATDTEKIARCESFGGEWDDYLDGCLVDDIKVPDTESACNATQGCSWDYGADGYECSCLRCDWLAINMETGVFYCERDPDEE